MKPSKNTSKDLEIALKPFQFKVEKKRLAQISDEEKRIIKKCENKILPLVKQAVSQKEYTIARVFAGCVPTSHIKTILLMRIQDSERKGSMKLSKNY